MAALARFGKPLRSRLNFAHIQEVLPLPVLTSEVTLPIESNWTTDAARTIGRYGSRVLGSNEISVAGRPHLGHVSNSRLGS